MQLFAPQTWLAVRECATKVLLGQNETVVQKEIIYFFAYAIWDITVSKCEMFRLEQIFQDVLKRNPWEEKKSSQKSMWR